VERRRVAVGRELQRGEAEHARVAVRVVARAAVRAPGDVVEDAVRDLVRAADAALGREHRVAAVLRPRVRGEAPGSVGEALDVARLDAPLPRELLPQLRARGERPRVGVGRVDRGALGQADPPALGGAVGPERVLRGERDHVGGDHAAVEVGVEARVREARGQRGRGGRGGVRRAPGGGGDEGGEREEPHRTALPAARASRVAVS
jgi:hypothetical protein